MTSTHVGDTALGNGLLIVTNRSAPKVTAMRGALIPVACCRMRDLTTLAAH